MKCKGGKILHRTITPGLAELLEDPKFANWRTPDGRFLLPKAKSVNKFLNRKEAKLGIEPHSFHSIRRMLAQERYNQLRLDGYDIERALGEVGLWLNHGPNRQTMVRKSYVANPW